MPEGRSSYEGDLIGERQAGAPSAFRIVVFNGRVLRAGWGLLLFAALFTSVLSLETYVIGRVKPSFLAIHLYLTPHDGLLQLMVLTAVLIATLVPSFLEQQRINAYGFRGSAFPTILTGALTSGILVVLMAAAMHVKGLLHTVSGVASGPNAIKYGAVWAFLFAMSALLEEMLTRGYLQYTLTRGLAVLYRQYFGLASGVTAAFWTAAVILSLFFSAIYVGNPGQSNVGLVCLFTMGLLYCLSLWRTGQLWWALGFHFTWELAQAWGFGLWSGGQPIRDTLLRWAPTEAMDTMSGGHAGLDGSVWVFLTLAVATAALMLLTTRHRVYPELWDLAAQESRGMHYGDTLPDPDRRR